MGYAMLEVSEVGPPEYPLIAVLHESIFGRPEAIAALRQPANDLLTLIAHLEGNPVGFLVAHGTPEYTAYVVDAIAILPDYRRQGLGARMLQWAEQHGRARGYGDLFLRAEHAEEPGVDALARRHGMGRDSGLGVYRKSVDVPTTPLTISAARVTDRPACPVCGVQGMEKKQKWFCPRCGQLIQTCCD